VSGDIQARLYGWIDRQLDAGRARGGLRELVLNHLNAADQLQEIARYGVTPEGENLQEIKTELYRTAVDVVSAWRHLQKFAVQSYFGQDDKAAAYYPIALADEVAAANAPEPTEPGNLLGALRQQMRHNEILAKINAGIMAEANSLLLNQSRQAFEALDELRGRHTALLKESEATLNARRKESFEETRVLAADARMGKMADSVATAVPAIVNRVSEHFGGPKLLPEGLGKRELLIGYLKKKLTDETVERLLAVFPDPSDQAVLFELFIKEGASVPGGSNGSAH
jgi:ElaB/YqjD/DUF883 family membrane-anchored ribosome-binding protein